MIFKMILLSILISFIYIDLLFFVLILMLIIYEMIFSRGIHLISCVLVIGILGYIYFQVNSSRFSYSIWFHLVVALSYVYDYFILIVVIFFHFFVQIPHFYFSSHLFASFLINLFIVITRLIDFMIVFMLICFNDISYMIFDNRMLVEMVVMVIESGWMAFWMTFSVWIYIFLSKK